MTITPADGWTLVDAMSAITTCQIDPTHAFPHRPACRAVLADALPEDDQDGIVLMAGDTITEDNQTMLGSGANLYARALRSQD